MKQEERQGVEVGTGGEAKGGMLGQEERQRVEGWDRKRGREWKGGAEGEAEGGKMGQEERQRMERRAGGEAEGGKMGQGERQRVER